MTGNLLLLVATAWRVGWHRQLYGALDRYKIKGTSKAFRVKYNINMRLLDNFIIIVIFVRVSMYAEIFNCPCKHHQRQQIELKVLEWPVQFPSIELRGV